MINFNQNSRKTPRKLILLLPILTSIILPSGTLLAGEIKLDNIINDIKTSLKHHKSNNNHQYDVSKNLDGKQYNLDCDTNLSPKEIARKALADPASIKANCRYNDDKKSDKAN